MKKAKQSLKERLFDAKVNAWSLYCEMQTLKMIEKTSQHDKDELYSQFLSSYKKWGGVELSNWLQGVARICREKNKKLERVAVFYLPKQSSSPDFKLLNLQSIAKQMGLDVTITKN